MMKNTKNEEYDESILWHQLMQGNRQGLEGLYIKFSRELFRYGMAIRPDRTLVKDCIQELFIDLWKYRERIKDTNRVVVYLCKSLSNKMYREIHLENRRREQNPLEVCESLYGSQDPKTWSTNHQPDQEKVYKLTKALDTLPERQREVIQYVFFEKLSSEEVSKRMGIAVQSVYTLTWKAIGKLKKNLLSIIFLF